MSHVELPENPDREIPKQRYRITGDHNPTDRVIDLTLEPVLEDLVFPAAQDKSE